MFVRVKNTPNSPRQSVQIVESWREGGKVRQRIVRNFGIAADNQEPEHLKSLAELIKAKIEEQIQPALFSPEELARLIHQGRQCKQPSQDKVAITNLPDMGSAEVLSHYHGLWQVEETFRISKHELRVRLRSITGCRAGARTHRDFVHGADVCVTSGLSSPAAVQAAVARSGAPCTVACSVRYCERSA